jgi:hypothetical protein
MHWQTINALPEEIGHFPMTDDVSNSPVSHNPKGRLSRTL